MSNRSEQELVRFAKLKKLREKSYPFPNDVKVNSNSKLLLEQNVEEPEKAARFCIAGRLVQIRNMGKAAFVHLLDEAGKIQAYVKKDVIGEESFEAFKEFDIGDIVEIKGYVFVTKTGEKSIAAESIRLLVKSLIPLPEKWHGLSDTEIRYRHRYVDLIANPEVREVFRKRSKIIKAVRDFLDARNYTEVETPVLHYIAGGATAKPFRTHYNALSCDMSLRIALELPLKKLIAGGLERVYEIGRNFRNEGLSKKHNPEFTMLEFYQAYATFEDLMLLTEEMLVEITMKINGTLKIPYGDKEIDFTPPWPKISMLDSIHEIGGIARDLDLNELSSIHKVAEKHNIKLDEKEDWGRSLEALWGELVEHKIWNPIFITHHPFSISPLARQNQSDPKITDRFELIIAGMETANAFSELNDAEDQRQRFEAQASRKQKGDQEASEVDEDFLKALEYGMPPTAGQGIGIDRLVMLLTNSATIRDVLLFPQLKPKEDDEQIELNSVNNA